MAQFGGEEEKRRIVVVVDRKKVGTGGTHSGVLGGDATRLPPLEKLTESRALAPHQSVLLPCLALLLPQDPLALPSMSLSTRCSHCSAIFLQVGRR